MGPGVTLNNAATATASFTAPTVSSDTLLRFQLEVTDPGGLSSISTASVTVTTNAGGGFGGSGGGGGGSFGLFILALLGGLAARRVCAKRTGAAG
jgi:hypothetical protein